MCLHEEATTDERVSDCAARSGSPLAKLATRVTASGVWTFARRVGMGRWCGRAHTQDTWRGQLVHIWWGVNRRPPVWICAAFGRYERTYLGSQVPRGVYRRTGRRRRASSQAGAAPDPVHRVGVCGSRGSWPEAPHREGGPASSFGDFGQARRQERMSGEEEAPPAAAATPLESAEGEAGQTAAAEAAAADAPTAVFEAAPAAAAVESEEVPPPAAEEAPPPAAQEPSPPPPPAEELSTPAEPPAEPTPAAAAVADEAGGS